MVNPRRAAFNRPRRDQVGRGLHRPERDVMGRGRTRRQDGCGASDNPQGLHPGHRKGLLPGPASAPGRRAQVRNALVARVLPATWL
jgi:hypothetical protein